MKDQKQENTAGYLAICMDDIPNNFRSLGSSPFDFSSSLIGCKEIFVWLANLKNDKTRIETMLEIIKRWAKTATMDVGDFETLSKVLAPVVDPNFLNFVSSYTFAWYRSAKRSDKKYGPNWFGACTMADRFASLLCDPTHERKSGLENRDVIICTIGSMDDVGLAFNAIYRPLFGYCGDKFTYLNTVTFKDVLSIVHFAALSILKDEVVIRKCQNCGDYFLPRSRSDEIYCDKQLPNGRTCKTVGYDTKIKQDKVIYEYRKIYKTQNARKQRNKQKENIDDRFKRWVIFAKAMLIKCQSGEIDLDEMIAAISSDDWMKKEV